jgi:uncharacterized membrane protein YraQ (UPF0718 family)
MKKSEKSYVGWYFLLIVIIFYFITGIFKLDAILPSLKFAYKIFTNVILIFILVFILMVVINYYITPKAVNRYLGKSSGPKRWFIAITSGIISTGPIYMWYPMLKELKKKGVSYGFIATFLYNRAVKLPLIPIIILYFGLTFTIILTIVMIIMSVIQGLIFEKMEKGDFL